MSYDQLWQWQPTYWLIFPPTWLFYIQGSHWECLSLRMEFPWGHQICQLISFPSPELWEVADSAQWCCRKKKKSARFPDWKARQRMFSSHRKKSHTHLHFVRKPRQCCLQNVPSLLVQTIPLSLHLPVSTQNQLQSVSTQQLLWSLKTSNLDVPPRVLNPPSAFLNTSRKAESTG